jgi:ABC-2 type transport system permease protein
MRLKITASIKKEFLLLIRDMAGLSMLFIMPIVLVILMALLQDSTFKVLDEKKVPVVIINNDHDIFGNNIVSGLSSSKFFDVTVLSANDVTELKKEVASGQYMIGIVVLKNATQTIQKNLNKAIYQQFPEEITDAIELDTLQSGFPAKVDVFFDPVLKNSFKQSVLSALREYSSGVEAQIVYKTYANLF